MFTKNWHRMIGHILCYNEASVEYKNTQGSTIVSTGNAQTSHLIIGSTTAAHYIPSMYYVRTKLSGDGGVIFGTGTVPPTIDDYALSGNIVTTITYSAAIEKIVDGEGVTMRGLYTLTNVGAEPVTIGEIALKCGVNGSSASSNAVIVERTVLETPITIEPGGVGQVTYTIRMNYPTV